MEVQLINWTGTLAPAYIAARNCKSKSTATGLIDGLTYSDTEELQMESWLHDKIVSTGHVSIFEHLTFTFAIDGISRACSHQLVRHRLASYAQKSQRNAVVKSTDYVLPESMCDIDQIDELFQELIRVYEYIINEHHIPVEDARYVLPNACTTSIVMTVNGRQLIEMSRKRLCSKAQWEIRELFEAIKSAVQSACPLIASQMGAPCAFGVCPEGEGSCH